MMDDRIIELQDIAVDAEDAEQEITLDEEDAEQEITLDEEETEQDIDLEDEASVVNLDYKKLRNKPQINGVTLVEDKSFEQLGVEPMTNQEILDIFNRVFGGD